MAFPYLDVNDGLTRSFTIAYKMTDDGAEHWTTRFNRFKAKRDRSALVGGVRMMEAAVPRLVKGLGLDVSRTTFVPALSSSETIASEKGILPVLALRCAEATGAGFVHDAITKRAHLPIHGIYNAAGRKAVLDKAEFKAGNIDADSILVFDDFITRGDTLSHIAQAILESNPGTTVYGVALGKAERRAYHSQHGVEISNDHVRQEWDTLWEQGERRYRVRKARSKS
jgi:hypothetical protein